MHVNIEINQEVRQCALFFLFLLRFS